MKTLLACVVSILVPAAYAGVINLPVPTVAEMGGSPWVIPQAASTAVTGFSTNGNYVLGIAEYSYKSGGGRGNPSHTYIGCATVVWDLSGNLVSFTNFKCAALPALGGYGDYTNAGGYSAYSLDNAGRYSPELSTP